MTGSDLRPVPRDRVTDGIRVGTLLRYERYPGTGTTRWATVSWDDMMSARRVDPKMLRRVR